MYASGTIVIQIIIQKSQLTCVYYIRLRRFSKPTRLQVRAKEHTLNNLRNPNIGYATRFTQRAALLQHVTYYDGFCYSGQRGGKLYF